MTKFPLHYYLDLDWHMVPTVPGDKMPLKDIKVSEKHEECRNRPSKEELVNQFNRFRDYDISVLTGRRSNGLIILDFDEHGAYEAFLKSNLVNHDCSNWIIDRTTRGIHAFFYTDKLYKTDEVDLDGIKFEVKAEKGMCKIHENWIKSPFEFDIPILPEFLAKCFVQLNSINSHFLKLNSINSSNSAHSLNSASFPNSGPLSPSSDFSVHVPHDSHGPHEPHVQLGPLVNSCTSLNPLSPVVLETHLEPAMERLMEFPVPPGKSEEYLKKFGHRIMDENKMIEWFVRGCDGKKRTERIKKVERYCANVLANWVDWSGFKVDCSFLTNQELLDNIEDEIFGKVRDKRQRAILTKMLIYFLTLQDYCGRMGLSRFYRSNSDIAKDLGIQYTTVSRNLPYIVGGLSNSNTIPIFQCVKYSRITGIANEYQINDDYRYLLGRV